MFIVENKFKILAEFEKDGFDIEFVDVTPFIETMSSKIKENKDLEKAKNKETDYKKMFLWWKHKSNNKKGFMVCSIDSTSKTNYNL